MGVIKAFRTTLSRWTLSEVTDETVRNSFDSLKRPFTKDAIHPSVVLVPAASLFDALCLIRGFSALSEGFGDRGAWFMGHGVASKRLELSASDMRNASGRAGSVRAGRRMPATALDGEPTTAQRHDVPAVLG